MARFSSPAALTMACLSMSSEDRRREASVDEDGRVAWEDTTEAVSYWGTDALLRPAALRSHTCQRT